MGKKEYEIIIAEIQTNLEYIKKAIDELKANDTLNRNSHSDIYKTIENNYKEDVNKFATKEELKEVWTTLKTLIYTSVSQVIAILLMIIFKLWK